MKAQGTFTVTSWQEKPLGGAAQSQVSAMFELSGAIAGQLSVEYLMHHTRQNEADIHDAEATYLGYLLFSGTLGGKSGSFVAEDKGKYSAAGPQSFFAIKPQTGTAELAAISGAGKYFAQGEQMVLELEYEL